MISRAHTFLASAFFGFPAAAADGLLFRYLSEHHRCRVSIFLFLQEMDMLNALRGFHIGLARINHFCSEMYLLRVCTDQYLHLHASNGSP